MNDENIEFLEETTFCDYSHPSIAKIGEEYKKNHINQKDLAVALFYFVRDKIYYRVGFWNRKASDTVIEKIGTCTNSANLLVALYRYVGIPAGYGVMKVKGQEYFGVITPYRLKKIIKKESTHVYVYVKIQNKWLKCDPSGDRFLAYNTQHFNPQSKLIEWDGNNHAEMNLFKEHIISDKGPVANIDYMINRKMKYHKIIPTKIANLYIEFLRDNGREFNNPFIAECKFIFWLRRKNIFYYIFYLMLGFKK